MIQINELRIGNLVKWYDVSKVLELHSEKNKFDNVCIECEESFEWTEYNKLEPIPLTEEWLLKVGFQERKDTSNFSNFWIGENPLTRDWLFVIKGFKEDNDFFFMNGFHKIKYVHQLQNLYFALTGAELTVA